MLVKNLYQEMSVRLCLLCGCSGFFDDFLLNYTEGNRCEAPKDDYVCGDRTEYNPRSIYETNSHTHTR